MTEAEKYLICADDPGIRKTPGGHRFRTLDGLGKEIDDFAVDQGHHNGPMCLDCHDSWCQHCDPECYEEQCEAILDVTPQLKP